tara:strand:- start:38968 stop:42339 length:3372 start_codon:yes stop_codon:yes gene_type:complete
MDEIEEERRLAALRELGLLDTEPEPGFDSITDLAVALTGAEMGAVSLIDCDRQWFKSRIGLDVSETARDIAFCDHVIRGTGVFYIPDTRKDERFVDNPLVVGEPNIRTYVGVPINSPDGYPIGALCVMSKQSFKLNETGQRRLQSLARLVQQEIEGRARNAAQLKTNRLLAAIAEAQTRVIADASSLRETFATLLATALEFTGSEFGFIGEILEESGARYLKAHAITNLAWDARTQAMFDAQAVNGLEFRNRDTLIGRAIATGESVFSNNPAADPRASGVPDGHPALTSYLGVPVYAQGDFVAMLGLANRPGGYAESLLEACQPLLMMIGNLVRAHRMEAARDQAAAELLATTSRLNLAIEGSSVGLWELNPQTGETFASARLMQMVTGGPLLEGSSGLVDTQGWSNFIDRVHVADRSRLKAAIDVHLERREPFEIEFRSLDDNGEEKWLYARGQAQWDSDGRAVRMAGSLEDHTEKRRLALEKSRASERLEVATRLGGIGAWEIDLESGKLFWDAVTRKIHDVSDDYVPDFEAAIQFYLPEARPIISAAVRAGMETLTPWDVELPMITASKRQIWVRVVGQLLAASDGRPRMLIGYLQDITHRKVREDELETLASRLALALDASGIGLWEYNPETGAMWCDEETRALFGISGEDSDFTAEGWMSSIYQEDRDRVIEEINEARRSRERCTVAYRIKRPDGSVRHVRAHGVFRRRLQGDIVMSGVNIDMTREVERAEELNQQRQAAEEANRAKSQFLANMSHEIRTPLNGVLGMSQLLQLTELTPKQASYVGTLRSAGKALLDLIEEVLDISRIEAGMIDTTIAGFELAPLVQSVLDMLDGTARLKSLKLDMSCAPDVPERVLGDQKHLRQILVNIIGNAVKFTAAGSVSVSVETGDHDEIFFRVTDTGPGIARDQLDRIFDRFAQVDASLTREHGGSGLGLAICRELIQLAGGDIRVESEVGVGSSFCFHLPLPAEGRSGSSSEQARGAGEASGRQPRQRGRVLVVDDTATNQLVAAALVEHAGYEVALASNGQQAIDAVEAGNVDAVLMDIQMPVMSGDEAMQRIRASGKSYSNVPIFAVTADATKGARERFVSMGATGYLSKPLDIKAVIAALGDALRPTG